MPHQKIHILEGTLFDKKEMLKFTFLGFLFYFLMELFQQFKFNCIKNMPLGLMGCDGRVVRMVYLLLALFIICWMIGLGCCSLGKAFGQLKPLLGFLSSFGQRLGGGSLLMITLCGEDTQWWVSVVCVVPMGRQSIVSFYTAHFRMCYGAFFSVGSMLIGLFRGVWRIYYLGGVIGLGSIILISGI